MERRRSYYKARYAVGVREDRNGAFRLLVDETGKVIIYASPKSAKIDAEKWREPRYDYSVKPKPNKYPETVIINLESLVK